MPPGGDKRTPPLPCMRPQRSAQTWDQGSRNGSREARPAPPGHGSEAAMRTRRVFAAVAVRYLRPRGAPCRTEANPPRSGDPGSVVLALDELAAQVGDVELARGRLADVGPFQQAPGQVVLERVGQLRAWPISSCFSVAISSTVGSNVGAWYRGWAVAMASPPGAVVRRPLRCTGGCFAGRPLHTRVLRMAVARNRRSPRPPAKRRHHPSASAGRWVSGMIMVFAPARRPARLQCSTP